MTELRHDSAAALRAVQDLRISFEIVTERIAKAARLNPRDLGVLDVLHAEGPATPKAIAARTGIHPTTLTAILTRLERDGRVHRYRNPDDARSSKMTITDKTVREIASLYSDIDDNLKQRFSAMSNHDRVVIVNFLQDLMAIIDTAPPSITSR
jgi:DNA-binding MarR family transcriptional regulator